MRLLYLVSHPIQYQAPLLRMIAADPDFKLSVIFESGLSCKNFYDEGFKKNIKWDVPLTKGFVHYTTTDIKVISALLLETDILWCHGWNSFFKRRVLRLAQKKGIPILMRGENTQVAMPDGKGLRGFLKRQYLKNIFNTCSGFLYIGEDNRRYYEEHGVDQRILFPMPYSVDNKFFQIKANSASGNQKNFRDEIGLYNDNPVILYAGKFLRRKNPHLLLEVFLELDFQKLGNPYLLFVGDGEMRGELQKKINYNSERVKFLGFQNQSQLPSYYELADVFVLPAEREPWGLAVNEAMNCGTAVLVSDQCGCARDLINESCGIVVEAGNKEELLLALTKCLQDREQLGKMGKEARKRISYWGLSESVFGLKRACQHLM